MNRLTGDRTCLRSGLVPVDAVFIKAIERGQIKPAAKPPHVAAGHKKPQVGMTGWCKWVSGVDDQRQGDRLKRLAGQLRSPFCGRRWQRFAMDMREIDGGFFDVLSTLQDVGP